MDLLEQVKSLKAEKLKYQEIVRLSGTATQKPTSADQNLLQDQLESLQKQFQTLTSQLNALTATNTSLLTSLNLSKSKVDQ